MVEETVINRTEGVSLSIKMQRGSSTNDRDTVKGKVHAQDTDELAEKRDDLLDEVEAAMDQARQTEFDEDDS